MGISIEKIRVDVWLVRMGAKHNAFGDPYDRTCVVDIDGEASTLKGAVGDGFQTKDLKFMIRELKKYGVREISWDRIKSGIKTTVSFPLRIGG